MLHSALLAMMLSLLSLSVWAEVSLSNDWPSSIQSDGRRVPKEQDESSRLFEAAETSVKRRDAMPTFSRAVFDLAFRLHVDEATYYLRGGMFMAKTRPDEVCNALPSSSGKRYTCKEGQRYSNGCHLFFFDSGFLEAGFYTLKINEPYRYFCNAMPAIGVYDKARNELLVTVQYFAIDGQPASRISEIGSGSNRMTVLFRVNAVDGKLVVEQDDRCLGNPNRVEGVPEARAALKKCEAKLQAVKK